MQYVKQTMASRTASKFSEMHYHEFVLRFTCLPCNGISVVTSSDENLRDFLAISRNEPTFWRHSFVRGDHYGMWRRFTRKILFTLFKGGSTSIMGTPKFQLVRTSRERNFDSVSTQELRGCSTLTSIQRLHISCTQFFIAYLSDPLFSL